MKIPTTDHDSDNKYAPPFAELESVPFELNIILKKLPIPRSRGQGGRKKKEEHWINIDADIGRVLGIPQTMHVESYVHISAGREKRFVLPQKFRRIFFFLRSNDRSNNERKSSGLVPCIVLPLTFSRLVFRTRTLSYDGRYVIVGSTENSWDSAISDPWIWIGTVNHRARFLEIDRLRVLKKIN